MKEKVTTIIFTSHYVEEVNYCADRVLLLEKGTLIADNTPYKLRMMDYEKIIFMEAKDYDSSKTELESIIMDNQIKVLNKNSTIELHFSIEKTAKIIEELLTTSLSLENIEMTNTSLLNTIFTNDQKLEEERK